MGQIVSYPLYVDDVTIKVHPSGEVYASVDGIGTTILDDYGITKSGSDVTFAGTTGNITTVNATTVVTGAVTLDGTAITSSGSELNLLDGSSTSNATAGKAVILDAMGNVVSGSANHSVTPNTPAEVTAVTYGDGYHMTTVIGVSSMMTIADNAALATGVKLIDFPMGAFIIKSVRLDMLLASADATIQADTPDIGIGTRLATGAVATLDLAGTNAENVLTGQTAADCNGTATVKTVGLATPLTFESSETDDHSLYLNVADTWGNGESTALEAIGTVVVEWQFMG